MRKGVGNAGPTEGRKSPARCAGLSRTGFALTSPYSIPGDDALRLGLHGTNGQRERAKAAEAQCGPCFFPRELAILGSAHRNAEPIAPSAEPMMQPTTILPVLLLPGGDL